MTLSCTHQVSDPVPCLPPLSSEERGRGLPQLFWSAVPDLLYDKRDPERGSCNMCRSLEFFVDLSDGTSNREGSMIYDRRSNCFMQTHETKTERLDVELLWKAYLETGELDVSEFLSDEIKFTSFDLNELLRIELHFTEAVQNSMPFCVQSTFPQRILNSAGSVPCSN